MPNDPIGIYENTRIGRVPGTGDDSDENVKVSNDDTTADHSDDKIIAGTGITLNVLNDGAGGATFKLNDDTTLANVDASEVRVNGNGNKIGLKAPAGLSSSPTWILPETDPGNDAYAMVTDVTAQRNGTIPTTIDITFDEPPVGFTYEIYLDNRLKKSGLEAGVGGTVTETLENVVDDASEHEIRVLYYETVTERITHSSLPVTFA